MFATHDKNQDPYREAICKGTEGVISEYRRKPACVGASFYGAPVYWDDSADRNFEFIAQNRMRKAWLVDQLFSDPFARKIVPFEVWSFTNVAPEIRF